MALLQIFLVSILPGIAAALVCYKCGSSANSKDACTDSAQLCHGVCALIQTANTTRYGVAMKTERMCVPKEIQMDNEKLCKVQAADCVTKSKDCTCSILRCTTDLCNGFSEYDVQKTEGPMMIVDRQGDREGDSESQIDSRTGTISLSVGLLLISTFLLLR